jgi:uncharacterized protein YyaL (SSP411 family)
MAGNLMAELFYLTGEERFRTRAESQLTPITGYFNSSVSNFAQAELTADGLVYPPAQMVLVGDKARQFWEIVNAEYLPRVLTVWMSDSVASDTDDKHPLGSLLAGKTAYDHRATAYFCRDFTCDLPITSAHKLRKDMSQLATPGNMR